jgi:hypothetical protein
MGFGVARQCSRNRCLARWTLWILHRGRRAEQVESELEERPGHGPDPRFLCPQAGEIIYFDLATLCEQAGIPLEAVRAAAAARRS